MNFIEAVDEGDIEVVKKHLMTFPELVKGEKKRTALHRAAGYGHTAIVHELIKAGINPQQPSNTGRTPVHEACQGGHVDVLKALLQYGGMEAADSQGQTPLHLAAYQGETECVRELCLQHATIAPRDQHLRTPIHLASMMNKPETIKCLIDFGADIDIPDENGRTCAHYAAGAADEKSLKVLLSRGVNLQVACKQGRLPLHYSLVGDSLVNFKLLLSHHTTDKVVSNQVKMNIMKIPDNHGRCSTHIAALHGSMKCLHWILEQGIDANIPDAKKNTALHLAAQKSNVLGYSCLLYHGALNSLLNSDGRTPMEIARMVGTPFAIQKASEMKCPACQKKGLDLEWEEQNNPADIIIAIESTKDVLFGAPPVNLTKRKIKSSGSVQSFSSTSTLSSSKTASTSSLLPKRNMATKYYRG